MRYKELGNTGEKVSAVALGTWALGNDAWGSVRDEESVSTIRKAMDLGINLIDTAPAYGVGHSEEVVGKAIEGRRHEVLISTKCGTVKKDGVRTRNLKPEAIRQELDDSLRRLNTDYIDIYLLHWPDPNTPLEDTIEEIVKLKKTGKFRYFGVSNFDVDALKRISAITPVECFQPQYSLLSRSRMEEIAYCHQHQIGCTSYGSLAGGILTGKFKEKPIFSPGDTRSSFYPFFEEPLWSKSVELIAALQRIAKRYEKPLSQLAINFANQNERITSTLVGAKTPKQVAENGAACDWLIAQEDMVRIEDLYQKIFAGTRG